MMRRWNWKRGLSVPGNRSRTGPGLLFAGFLSTRSQSVLPSGFGSTPGRYRVSGSFVSISPAIPRRERLALGEISIPFKADPPADPDMIDAETIERTGAAQLRVRKQRANGSERRRCPPDRPGKAEPVRTVLPADHRQADSSLRVDRNRRQAREPYHRQTIGTVLRTRLFVSRCVPLIGMPLRLVGIPAEPRRPIESLPRCE